MQNEPVAISWHSFANDLRDMKFDWKETERRRERLESASEEASGEK